MKQTALTVLRVLVVVVLGWWLATRVDWNEFAATYARLRPLEALAGLAVLWAGLGVAVWRWHVVLAALGSRLTSWETARLFASGLFLSLFLPTGIGGDVYRLARVQRDGFGIRRGAVSLAYERGIGLLALLLVTAPAVVWNPNTRDFATLAAALGGGAFALLFAFRVWGHVIFGALSERSTRLGSVFGPDVRGALLHVFWQVLFSSLVIHGTTVATCALFARALGVGLTAPDALALIPLIILAGQLPIAPGGLGIREAAFVFFLGRVGIPESEAFAVGLAWLMALYLTGVVGGILFLFERRAGARNAA